MTSFKIRFDYNELGYTANVHKTQQGGNYPVQYVVVDMDPEMENAPPVFVYCPEKHPFQTSDCNEPGEVPNEIIKAIKNYCIENSIPLA